MALLLVVDHVLMANEAVLPIGLGLGLLLWLPYYMRLWKRMWELYELDKQNPVTPFAPGATPVARG